MLSLKDTSQNYSSSQSASSSCRLLDLPSELLAQIVYTIAHDDYATQILSPLSLTCKQLRYLSQSLLFVSVNLVLSRRFLRRGETFTGWLLCNPRIRQFVKHVAVRAPLEPNAGDDESEAICLIKLLPMLSSLQSLW